MTDIKEQTQLPDKMSELIELALYHLPRFEKDARYKIDMGLYHRRFEGVCHVCFAGVVMAGALGADIDCNLLPYSFGSDEKKLHALDELRLGGIYDAAIWMGIALPDSVSCQLSVTPYDENPAQFRADMQAMAEVLRGHGL